MKYPFKVKRNSKYDLENSRRIKTAFLGTSQRRMCHNKRTFTTTKLANNAIHRLQNSTDKTWRYYRCPYCKHFHLTTTPKK